MAVMAVSSVSEREEGAGMENKEEHSIVKRKIVAVDKLVRNKQRMESRNAKMSLVLEERQKELEEATIAREEILEKYGEARRDVCKKEEEMKKMEDHWKGKMKKKEVELKEANITREEILEKYEVWRSCKKEEEMEKMEEDWKGKMKKKEEELEEKDNQIKKLRSELAKEKKDKDEAKEELDTIKHTYVSIGDLLSRKRGAGPTDLGDGDSSSHKSP